MRSVTRAYIGDDAPVVAGTTHLDADSDAETTATIKHAGIVGFVWPSASPRSTLSPTRHRGLHRRRGTITLTRARSRWTPTTTCVPSRRSSRSVSPV